MIPIRGAWSDVADEVGLQTPGKNPMSIVMDRDKVAVSYFNRAVNRRSSFLQYGCTDGSIVLVSFTDP